MFSPQSSSTDVCSQSSDDSSSSSDSDDEDNFEIRRTIRGKYLTHVTVQDVYPFAGVAVRTCCQRIGADESSKFNKQFK